MPSEWRETTLGEICACQGGSIQTGPFGSQLHASDYKETGVPVVMPTNIGDGGIAAEGIARISSEDADRLKQHKLNLGDVVFSRRGDVTRNALIQSHEVGWLCGTGCLKVRLGNESRAKAKFIAYCLRLPETKEWLVRHAVGATMPNLNTSILSAVPMLLPPMDIQEEASGMLGALDDKIALLRETNATLEAIAQALFKSWFVDFDPVRAKTEGRDPEGVPTEVADLFPSEFEDSELGAIPKGWRVGHFYDVAGLHKQVRQPQENPDTEFEHYSLPAFDAGQSPALETGSAIKSNKFTVPKDAVLLSKLNPHIPRVWLTKVVNESAAISSTEFLVLGPRRGTSREWVYLLVRSEGVQSALCQLVTGTSNSHQRVKPDNVLELPIVCPPPPVIASFTDHVVPLLDRFLANREETISLANLRDTLLPRLMSGKLRIPDVEEVLA